MFNITLSDEERRIVDELHTDFTKIPNFDAIVEAVKIHNNVDWFWSYSDMGSTLRHGEERVNLAVSRMLDIAERHRDDNIRKLATMHPVTFKEGGFEKAFAELFPWFAAYRYSKSTSDSSLAVELEITGNLVKFNEILDVLARQVWLFTKDMPAVYNQTIMSNQQIGEISRLTGVTLPSLQTYIYNHRGVAVPEKIFQFATNTAHFAKNLFEMLDLINFRRKSNINLLTPQKDDVVDLTLGFREAHINNDYTFTTLCVFRKGMSFHIPICANSLR